MNTKVHTQRGRLKDIPKGKIEDETSKYSWNNYDIFTQVT